MTLEQKRDALVAELAAIRNGQERFARLIERGRGQPALDAELKTNASLVEGCLSRLWFHAEIRANCCHFQADSDSAVVKGIARLLCEFYSGHKPHEIIHVPPSFLRDVGITQHLTPNRRNGLARLWEKIHAFAQSHLKS